MPNSTLQYKGKYARDPTWPSTFNKMVNLCSSVAPPSVVFSPHRSSRGPHTQSGVFTPKGAIPKQRLGCMERANLDFWPFSLLPEDLRRSGGNPFPADAGTDINIIYWNINLGLPIPPAVTNAKVKKVSYEYIFPAENYILRGTKWNFSSRWLHLRPPAPQSQLEMSSNAT